MRVAVRVGIQAKHLAVLAAFLALIASGSVAGQPRGFGAFRRPIGTWASAETLDTGAFQFCRLVFRQASNGDGNGWGVDFPRADENLSIRLSELTRTPVGMDEANEPR